MSYQALLFCLDERLARVVTQVFSELDFTVEPVHEPFAAVKKLMAQRYDAVVVDCENEPNATLLFKSARNSASNQSSLALALVEGQAGVAKAYRIGANLVLTKPINVEQAKGTLRVARGLLRKTSDAATPGPGAPVKTTPAAIPVRPAIQNVEMPPEQPAYEIPAFEAELPAMAASIKAEIPVAAPVVEAKTVVLPEATTSAHRELAATLFEVPRPAARPAAPAPSKTSPASPAGLSGAASAPAPAREISIPAETKPAVAPVEQKESAAPSFGMAAVGSSPSFGALDDQDSGGSGNKKILIVAAVVLVAAALGYFGFSKMSSKPSSPAPTVSATQSSIPASSTPVSAKPSAVAPEPTISVPQPSPTQSKAPGSVNTGVIAVSPDAEPEVVTKKIAPPAIVVKTPTSAKTAATRNDDAAPQMPNPMAIASGSDTRLSGLGASVPTALPAPSLSTVKISQGVSQGLLIKKVQPRYPQNALSMRIQGAVQLQATINKEGSISNLKVISGDPVLTKAAADAVRQWRYKPYYLNGEPVEIETQVTINFKLPN